MVKNIAIALILSLGLSSCSSGPEHGYYDQAGVYHPSAKAENEDTAQTVGLAALAATAVAGLAVAIHAATK